MTDTEKLNSIKTILDDGGPLPSDEKITVYIELAGKEMLSWKYHLVGGVPDDVVSVPEAEEVKQIYAVIAGYTHAGSEGQVGHSENGISRTFKYGDMIDYIRNNVIPYAKVW